MRVSGVRLLVAASCCLALSLPGSPARADVHEFLGRPLRDVRVELGGALLTDPSVAQLIETRIGEPLSMERVRDTIEHLIGVGRFEDVRVFAAASSDGQGVVLRWVLAPVQRVARIEFIGPTGFDAGLLRARVADRTGSLPATSRLDDILEVLGEYFRDRGYRRPAFEARIIDGPAPERVTLVVAITPGPRTLVGQVVVQSEGESVASATADLRLERGRPFDRPAIDARLEAFEEQLRNDGYYEAEVDMSVVFSEDGGTANLTVDVARGPRVRVVLLGDPVPDNRRDALVPIRQERSIDLDLLEDASRNIEAFFRQQGYRAAEAPYVRETRGGETVLTFTVARGSLHRLASLEAVGQKAIAPSEIEPLLVLQRGEPFVDSRVATVAAAVAEMYRVRGFARATVRPEVSVLPPRVESDGQEFRPVAVRLVITEGPQTTIRNLALTGVSAIPESEVRAPLALLPGRPFYRPQLNADREAIERLYQNAGFQHVRIDAQTALSDDGSQLDLEWAIREGPQTLVDHILITGNARTGADVIRREVVLAPGRPLGADALVESQRRLAALGLFRRVRLVELPHGASTRRDIVIEVEEAPPTTISYGGGLEAGRRLRRAADAVVAEERLEVAPRGFFEISRRNLWGKNRSATLFARASLRSRDPAIDAELLDRGGYGFNEYRLVGTFREPRPFDSAGDLQLTAFLEQALRSSFNFNRRGVRAEYGRRVGDRVTVSGRYAIDRTRLFDEQILPDDQLLIDRLFPQVRLSTFTGSILRDSRDDVLDPGRGAVLGVDGALAARAIGSEVGFAKTFGQAFAYRRLPGRSGLTVAAGLRVGLARGFARAVDRPAGGSLAPGEGPLVQDVITDVPASERFFAGGDTTVRGFVLDRLGAAETLNVQGFPTGGNALIVMNTELRTPYWKGLGGVGFVDVGNVFRRAREIALGELRPAAGFGLRYRSPLGPLRFDLGLNLDRRLLPSGQRERGAVFHLSLGQAF
jgi:outer membrane protein insertion porin family